MHALLHSVPTTLQQATADPRLRQRLLDTHGQVWVSFLWSHCSFLLGPDVHKVVCALQESVSPVLSKFCKLYGGVNGDLLQEGLCHIQVCCTQGAHPCGRPLLTQTSTGDTQTQFWLSLCGTSRSWCTQGLSEPSERLWRLWGLILNAISLLLPSFWAFSFAPGQGVSPQSCSNTAQWMQSQVGLRKHHYKQS